jgi:nitroreductase
MADSSAEVRTGTQIPVLLVGQRSRRRLLERRVAKRQSWKYAGITRKNLKLELRRKVIGYEWDGQDSILGKRMALTLFTPGSHRRRGSPKLFLIRCTGLFPWG